MSEYLKVDPTVDQGPDEGSPDNDQAVWDWLTGGDSGLTKVERVRQAQELGRYDIVRHLQQPA